MRLLRGTSSDALPLALACVLMGAILSAITVGGTFTNDESHYLATITALKGGTFRLESTAGLMPSRELLSFGAINYFRAVAATPAAPVAPPLYAFLALPFSHLGWRGLVLLNTASFIATGIMVFALAKHHASRRVTAWLALLLYWFASFSLEYAVGVWPHCLAVMLCTGAVLLVHRATLTGSLARATLAGLLIGIATGVRYQELIYGALLGATLLFWSLWSKDSDDPPPLRARVLRAVRLGAAYAAGAAPPFALMAYVNHARLGSWNPISKGPGYANLSSLDQSSHSVWYEWTLTFGMKVLDFSLCPPFVQAGESENYRPSPVSGAVVYDGVVKKALLQSAPWLMVAFLGLALSWRTLGGLPDRARRELRGLSIIVFGIIAAFSIGGLARTEGYCFNMRYFLELMPLGAVATAWLVQRYAGWKPILGMAALAGMLPALSALIIPASSPVRHLVILRAPLVLAALLAIAALHARRTERGRWLGPAFAACAAWAFVAHAGEDLLGSLRVRARHEYYLELLREQVPKDRTALFAYWSATTPFSPLTLDHDLVIADPFLDAGQSARALSEEMMQKGFHVFVVPQKMPAPIVQALMSGRHQSYTQANGLILVELRSEPPDER